MYGNVFPEQADSIDGQFCIRYIQGFIDGVVVTCERALLNVEAEFEKKETYAERVGLRNNCAARYAEFCLGAPVSLREVNDLKASKRVAEAMTLTAVYISLRKHCPCELGSKNPS